MAFIRIYLRVLGLLRSDARLAIALALANIALAGAQFVEPVLLGRIVDALSGALPGLAPAARMLAPLIGAWVGFGLFIIAASTLVAWFADRLAHRRRNMVLADYFEHVLQLPLAYHSGAHSGRQIKVMLSGTDTLWWLWVSFFREHFAAFVFIALLLPASLALNWRLALPLIALCFAFVALTMVVMHKAFAMQTAVERHYSDVAETTADALGNVALVQSYARVELEVSSLKSSVDSLLRAQMPVLSWWAVAAVLTRAGTTLTLLVILLVGAYLKLVGLASVGEIVSFMSIAALLIARLEQVVSFSNRLFLDAPKLADFFGVLDTVPAVRDRPGAIDPGRVRGAVEFKDVSFSYDGRRVAVAHLSFTASPGERIALVGPPAAANPPRSRCCIAPSIRNRARSRSTAGTFATSRSVDCGAISALCSRRRYYSTVRSPKTCASASRTRASRNYARPRRERRRYSSSMPMRKACKRASASAGGYFRAASASGSLSRARCSRIRRSSFSTRRRAHSIR
jgi:ATP-binding cassette subfamily B protein